MPASLLGDGQHPTWTTPGATSPFGIKTTNQIGITIAVKHQAILDTNQMSHEKNRPDTFHGTSWLVLIPGSIISWLMKSSLLLGSDFHPVYFKLNNLFLLNCSNGPWVFSEVKVVEVCGFHRTLSSRKS